MNRVDIDESALAAEVDAALADAGLEGADVTASDVVAGESWAPFVAGLVPVLRGVVIPQWSVQSVQLKEFGESLTQCLDQAFPGGVSGQYACWARLLMCSAGIVVGAIVSNGGALPPLGPVREAASDDGEKKED